MNTSKYLGPIMADLTGYSLTLEEKNRLLKPEIGGVILFRRNYQSVEQLCSLVKEIKALKSPSLLVAVDHEGGRVQRFIEGFTRLPAMRTLGKVYDEQGAQTALKYAKLTGWVLATELRAVDIDFSFTPVLDLDWGKSSIIGDRSFHSDPTILIQLASAFMMGLERGGMVGCGKHYPGHGYVQADSHLELPQDDRDFTSIQQNDLFVFAQMIKQGMSAIMPAHVVYACVDKKMPAGYSKIWLQDILRDQLNFKGLIFSDSLTMEGASVVGDIVTRVKLSKQAGCDIFLICNQPDLVDLVLDASQEIQFSDYTERWRIMRGCNIVEVYQNSMQTDEFKQAQEVVAGLYHSTDISNGVGVGEAI